jgi:hypothetical protein
LAGGLIVMILVLLTVAPRFGWATMSTAMRNFLNLRRSLTPVRLSRNVTAAVLPAPTAICVCATLTHRRVLALPVEPGIWLLAAASVLHERSCAGHTTRTPGCTSTPLPSASVQCAPDVRIDGLMPPPGLLTTWVITADDDEPKEASPE